jgi:(p)ppGpp synthase/HD superfamily hydrolase
MAHDSAEVTRYAQTHLQLLNQLRDHGYSSKDLVTVERAHRYARDLFAGSYRPSGKPFVCHLVGTASVLASLKIPVTVVAAGLLHAAYPLGDFGAGWLGSSDRKRTQLRQRMGSDVEDLINRYTLHPWEVDTPAELEARLANGDEIDREVVLIRLANEVDDHLDSGILYCRNAAERLIRMGHVRHSVIELARRLEQPQLSHALATAFEQCLSAQVTEQLRTSYDLSFVVPTTSRARWRLRRIAATLVPRKR